MTSNVKKTIVLLSDIINFQRPLQVFFSFFDGTFKIVGKHGE